MARVRRFDELCIATYNANSIYHDLLEVRQFLEDENIDIMLVSETHLKPGLRANIANYNCYRTDRLTAGGGTAIYIKRSIRHFEAPVPELRTTEATAVAVETTAGIVTFVAVYRSPKRLLHVEDIRALLRLRGKVFIAGDLNSKHAAWNSRTTTISGRRLLHVLEQEDAHACGPDEPTHYPSHGNPDVLDIAITKGLNQFMTADVKHALNSNHLPVIFRLAVDPTMQETRINIRKTHWPRYRQQIIPSLEPHPNVQDVDVNVAVGEFNDVVTAALLSATPPPRGTLRSRPGLPMDILDLIRVRNRLAKEWRLTRDPALKRRVNQMRRDIKAAIIAHKNEQWAAKLRSFTPDATAWDVVRFFTKKKRMVPPLETPTGMGYTPTAKADALADVFQRNFLPVDDPIDHQHARAVEESITNYLSEADGVEDNPIPLITPEEVSIAIRALPANKAPGPDDIPGKALKELPREAAGHLAGIFNAIIVKKTYPNAWKHSVVVPVPKQGKNRKLPASYRPISLLSQVSKLFERLLLHRLKILMDQRRLIPPEQFGFQSGHSTVLQIIRVVEDITLAYNNKEYCGALFLDVSKAFDSVWHHGLLWKLHLLGLPRAVIQLLASYLQGRTFAVRVANSLSTVRPIEAGVPQGSVLGPTLYTLYTSDLPKSPRVERAIYADDTAIYTRSRWPQIMHRRLQDACVDIEEWSRKWRLRFNAQKSQAIVFTRRRLPQVPRLQLFGEDIEWKNSVTYLGVILDRQLTWREQITAVHRKVDQRLGALYPLLNQRSALSEENGLLIYRMYVRPVMDYGGAAWGNAATTHMKRLQSIQNKALRRVFHVHPQFPSRYLHEAAQEPRVIERLQAAAQKMYNKARVSENPLIRNLGVPNEETAKYKRPVALLQR